MLSQYDVVHGYLPVAELHQLHAFELDPLAGRGQLSAIRHDERTRVRTGKGPLGRKGVALFDVYIYGHGAVREGGFFAAPDSRMAARPSKVPTGVTSVASSV